MLEIVKAHGSLNDLFLVPMAPEALFDDEEDRTRFVTRMCARGGEFGADGIYFIDLEAPVPVASYYNADGSYAEYCGNGLRCVGRWLLEYFGSRRVEVVSGGVTFTVAWAAHGNSNVKHVTVRSTAPVASPTEGLAADPIPAYSDDLSFSFLMAPNPHLVASVETYDQRLLEVIGTMANGDRERYPNGANTSFVVPVRGSDRDYFVRTFERGVGLTPSCASGAVAAAVSLVARQLAPIDTLIRIHNSGGIVDVRVTRRRSGYFATQSGNASFIERILIDPRALKPSPTSVQSVETGESDEYTRFLERSESELVSAGILSAA